MWQRIENTHIKCNCISLRQSSKLDPGESISMKYGIFALFHKLLHIHEYEINTTWNLNSFHSLRFPANRCCRYLLSSYYSNVQNKHLYLISASLNDRSIYIHKLQILSSVSMDFICSKLSCWWRLAEPPPPYKFISSCVYPGCSFCLNLCAFISHKNFQIILLLSVHIFSSRTYTNFIACFWHTDLRHILHFSIKVN